MSPLPRSGSPPSIADHPVLRDLRVVREPRPRVMRVVEALCRLRDVPRAPDPDWRERLPTDAELAHELGVSVSAVRGAIDDMALLLVGLEMLETRARIYVWYWHHRWERGVR